MRIDARTKARCERVQRALNLPNIAGWPSAPESVPAWLRSPAPPAAIQQIISYATGMDWVALTSPARPAPLARARHRVWAWYAARSPLPLKGIALPYGRDHTTVLSGIQRIEYDAIDGRLTDQDRHTIDVLESLVGAGNITVTDVIDAVVYARSIGGATVAGRHK